MPKRNEAERVRQLASFSMECRRRRPLVERERLPPAEEAQCQIIGGSFISWLEEHGPRFVQERNALSKTFGKGLSREPAVVFSSNMLGLVAAAEILDGKQERIVWLFEDEYRDWLKQSPDETYRWHIHTWSFFREPVKTEFEQEAKAKHPIEVGCVYWQHSEGTMFGELNGRGGDHLWKWDGTKAELLEEAFSRWVS